MNEFMCQESNEAFKDPFPAGLNLNLQLPRFPVFSLAIKSNPCCLAKSNTRRNSSDSICSLYRFGSGVYQLVDLQQGRLHSLGDLLEIQVGIRRLSDHITQYSLEHRRKFTNFHL